MENIKNIIREINQAFRESNGELFARHCHENVSWKMVGHAECYQTRQGIIDFMKTGTPNTLILTEDEPIVEGNRACCTGTMEMPNKDGSTFKGEYCDVYLFENGLVTELVSYVVETKD